MTFIEPWFLGRKLQFGVDLFERELGFLSDYYDEKFAGGRLSLTKALGSDFLIGTVSYTLQSAAVVNVDPTSYSTNNGVVSTNYNAPPEIVQQRGYSFVSELGAGLAYDTRNSVLLPSKGHRSEIHFDVATAPGGPDCYKMEVKSAWFFPGLA